MSLTIMNCSKPDCPTVLPCCRCPNADGVVFCAAAEDVQSVAGWLQTAGAPLPVRPQVQDPDLGQRMIAALTAAVAASPTDTSQVQAQGQGQAAIAATAAAGSEGRAMLQQQYAAAIVIGTDVPDLSSEVLSAAVEALLGTTSQAGEAAAGPTADIVLGPSADGGYFLIGFRTEALLLPAVQSCKVFEGVEWSSSTVLTRTVAAAEKLGLQVAHAENLPVLQDIDTLQDAAAWLSGQQQSSCQRPGQPGDLATKQQQLQQEMLELLLSCCNVAKV